MRSTWEDLTEAGRELQRQTDLNRWQMGALARMVTIHYGADSLGQYAAAVNVRARTMRDYYSVAAFYDNLAHDAPNLTWSHHREAKRLEDHELAMRALDKASDRDWIVERFAAVVTRYNRMWRGKAARERQAEPEPIADFNGPVVYGSVSLPVNTQLIEGKTYRWVVYAIEQEAQAA